MKHGKILFSAYCLLFSGCLFEKDDSPDYPPLRQSELAGCWYSLQPVATCYEECFDSNGNFFAISTNTNDAQQTAVLEHFGNYVLEGRNSINLAYKTRSTGFGETGMTESLPTGHTRSMTVALDTLFFAGQGELSGPSIRSDSAHTCSPHFRLFQRPENWSLE